MASKKSGKKKSTGWRNTAAAWDFPFGHNVSSAKKDKGGGNKWRAYVSGAKRGRR
jgi:hypothetical protein